MKRCEVAWPKVGDPKIGDATAVQLPWATVCNTLWPPPGVKHTVSPVVTARFAGEKESPTVVTVALQLAVGAAVGARVVGAPVGLAVVGVPVGRAVVGAFVGRAVVGVAVGLLVIGCPLVANPGTAQFADTLVARSLDQTCQKAVAVRYPDGIASRTNRLENSQRPYCARSRD